MRIVAFSDTHGMHRDIGVPPGDVLIYCGDIVGHNYIEEVYDFNNWLSELPHKYKIVIAGNHDGCLQEAGFALSSIYLSNAIYLENSGCIISHHGKDYNIWGSPITPRFLDWHFMEDRGDAISKIWGQIPYNVDILVTHGGPRKILDETPDHQFVGCYDLDRKIKQIEPMLSVFGHIHHSYGCTKIKKTIFANCSVCTEDYDPINEPIIIDI